MNSISSDVDPTGQAWLAGVPSPCVVRVADMCLHKLCRKFLDKCPPPAVSPLPAELDDLSLACLLLAVEWGNRAPATTSADLAACLDKSAGRFWGDRLPWCLALDFCRHNPRGVSGLDDLAANLDHHNSSIRFWMFEMAWCVRARLNPVEATARLLKNVADTLGYWDSALGLCRSLYPTDEAFWAAADSFQPEDLADQYRDRITLARKEGLPIFEQRFLRLELRLRQLIDQTALALTPDEIKIVEDGSK
jgi:hypothetical protein